MSKFQKKKLKYAKELMHDQINEKKLDKYLNKKNIYKFIVNQKYLNFPVVKNGIKNNFVNIEKEYLQFKKEILKIKDKEKYHKQKSKLKSLKLQYKIELKNFYNEIKQINKLNEKPKGYLKSKINPENIIEVRNLNKFYTSKKNIYHAIKDLNFQIKKGSFVVILGTSGSGKTTLLNMLSGLDRATYGEIIVEGDNLQALSMGKIMQFRRHKIGFIFQTYNLLSTLNAYDNVEVGRRLQTEPLKHQNIDDIFEEMGISSYGKKYTYELSGGEQQKISVARALVKTPSILIADEPTGALDEEASLKIFEIFQKINKKYKTTIILVTHNKNIAQLANQVIHIKDGIIKDITYNKQPKKVQQLRNI